MPVLRRADGVATGRCRVRGAAEHVTCGVAEHIRPFGKARIGVLGRAVGANHLSPPTGAIAQSLVAFMATLVVDQRFLGRRGQVDLEDPAAHGLVRGPGQ